MHLCGQILWQACCYAVCAAAFAASQAAAFVPAMALSMVGMAFVMAFNFMALHETVHRSAFKSRIWNDVFMQVAGLLTLRPVSCALPCLLHAPRRHTRALPSPASAFAPRLSAAALQALHYFYYHWAHHKFTGDPEKDSELIPSPLDMDVTTITGYFLYVSGLPFWFDAVTSTVKHAMGICPEHYLSAAKAKKEITTEARIYCAFYLALAAAAVLNPAFGAGLLTYVVLPSVLGQPFLRFYLMAEHRGCAESTNVLENTRTMEANWLIRQMAWQMPYHLEHHAWPYVPFHKLEEANKLVVASGGWSKDSCAPTGEQGYVGLNQKVVQKLFIKATK